MFLLLVPNFPIPDSHATHDYKEELSVSVSGDIAYWSIRLTDVNTTGVTSQNLDNSLMLITALNKHIGYDNATKIAKIFESDVLFMVEITSKPLGFNIFLILFISSLFIIFSKFI